MRMKARAKVVVRDVAARAGVSVGTVSNVINHAPTVHPDVARRVQKAIDELHYVPNEAARRLRVGGSSAIGLIVPDIRNPFFTDIAYASEREAERHGLSVVLGNSDEDPDREASYLELFEQQQVRGIIIAASGDVSDRLLRLQKQGTSVVLIERSAQEGLNSVSIGDFEGGRLAAAHLLSLGRRRLAFVGGPTSLRGVSDRLMGARTAVMAVADATFEIVDTGPQHSVAEGRRIAEMLLERPPADLPDAVFAVNDLVALGLVQAFMQGSRLHVPRDVAVIGFDDIDFAAASIVHLSSIRAPSERLGRTAVQMLIEEFDTANFEPQHVVFEPKLVIRDSTVSNQGTSPSPHPGGVVSSHADGPA